MPNDEFLTDEYVAELLAKEASDCSLKYSALGLEAFDTKSKPANLPKPNTRFLRNIIKDTDTHNKALLAKEAAESKARLKDLEHSEEVKRQKLNPNAKDIRRRQLGDIQSILGGRKRTLEERTPTATRDKDLRRKTDGRYEDETGFRATSRSSRDKSDLTRGQHRDRREHKHGHERLSKDEHHRRRSGKRSHLVDTKRSRRRRHEDSSDEEGRRRHRRDRSGSPRRRRRSRSPEEKHRRHRDRSPVTSKREPKREPSSPRPEEDSDPLEDFIGPKPLPKYRGRGAVAGSSGMDMRFSEYYDPKLDIVQDDENVKGDWDDAVESYRDRQKLRQNMESRLREVGLENIIVQKKMSPGQEEKKEEDVVWSKPGQEREWDRGKGDHVLKGILSEE